MICLFQPDYDDIEDDARLTHFPRGKSDKGKDNKKYGKFYSKLNKY